MRIICLQNEIRWEVLLCRLHLHVQIGPLHSVDPRTAPVLGGLPPPEPPGAPRDPWKGLGRRGRPWKPVLGLADTHLLALLPEAAGVRGLRDARLATALALRAGVLIQPGTQEGGLLSPCQSD